MDNVQEDLDELLQSNNIYSDNVYINSVATLDFADALGEKLNIVNGSVEIHAIASLDSVKLQAVVNRVKTTTGNFGYLADNASAAMIRFDSLFGVADLSVAAPHGLYFGNLVSANTVVLGDNYANKVDAVDFASLSTVVSIGEGTVVNVSGNTPGSKVSGSVTNAHTINFKNAETVDLGMLPYYSGNQLSITLDSGGALNLSSIDDVDSSGTQKDLDLTIDGALMVSLPNYDDGNFTANDVETVDLPMWTGDSGALTLTKVTHVKLGAIESNFSIGTSSVLDNDLETLDITAAKGSGSSDKAPVFAFYSTSLESATVAGVIGNLTFSDSPNLETLEVTANSAGTITLNNNASLENVTLSGEAAGVVVTSNASIETLEIGTTTVKSDATSAKLDGVITVKNNPSLSMLTVGADDIEMLTITGNPDLATVDLSSLTKIGATAEPTVYIYDNDLTASKLADLSDGSTDVANGDDGDLGAITTASGLDTGKAYFEVVAANAKATAKIYFDSVDEFVDEADASTSNHTYVVSSVVDQVKVLDITANTAAAAKDSTKAKEAYLFSGSVLGEDILFDINGNPLFSGGSGPYEASSAGLVLSGNNAVNVTRIMDPAHVANALAEGIVLNAVAGGNSSVDVTFISHNGAPATASIGERHSTAAAFSAAVSATNYGVGPDDEITLTVGSNSVTVSNTGGPLSVIVADLAAAYNTEFGPTGASAKKAVATVTNALTVLTITGLDRGSRGHGLNVSVSVKAGTVTATNALNLDWIIGNTISSIDNKTDSNNFIITFESVTAGIIDGAENRLMTAGSAPTVIFGAPTLLAVLPVQLGSTELTIGTDPNKDTYTAQQESRADVRNAEAGIPAGASNGSNYSRIGWL